MAQKLIFLQGILCEVGHWDDECLGIQAYENDTDFYKNHSEQEIINECLVRQKIYENPGKIFISIPKFCQLISKKYKTTNSFQVGYHIDSKNIITKDNYQEIMLKKFYGGLDTTEEDDSFTGIASPVNWTIFHLKVGGHDLKKELEQYKSWKQPYNIVFVIEII